MAELAPAVKIWWVALSAVGVLNIVLWLLAYRRLVRIGSGLEETLARYRWLQYGASGIYVLGCASRSFVIRADVRRLSMFDSWITSVMVGRTIATVAEIAFVVQWAALLHLLARRQNLPTCRRLAASIVPLIVIAEIASWYAALTTNSIGTVIEESIWALTALLFALGLALCYPRATRHLRRCIATGLVMAAGYIGFMVTVDVPTYVARWEADEAAERTYLSIAEGLQDIRRYEVTGRWEDWRYDMVWMSLYFSLAVWVSLLLVFWPRFEPEETPRR